MITYTYKESLRDVIEGTEEGRKNPGGKFRGISRKIFGM